jgi:pimeloyl-ACP methyl ester carboxylesterase
MARQPEPFRVEIPDSALEDLKARLVLSRLPDPGPAGDSWAMGTPRSVALQLLEHWRDGYDWRAAEATLNEMPQFTMDVPTTTQYTDGEPMNVHFVHKRGASEDAVPLLLLHGWPGSFWEFEGVLDPLTNGIGHPGSGLTQSFHVVAPSLPGYTFSEAPRTMGFDVAAMGRLFDRLMIELGYTEYVVQGGDWVRI